MPAAGKFCQDTTNVHGKADCFRELIDRGPGLHVCVMQPGYEKGDPDNNFHNIHIDQFQKVCVRQADGKCGYQHLARNSFDHYLDAIPWVLTEWLPTKLKPKPADPTETETFMRDKPWTRPDPGKI
jgi:hypothetical protein